MCVRARERQSERDGRKEDLSGKRIPLWSGFLGALQQSDPGTGRVRGCAI